MATVVDYKAYYKIGQIAKYLGVEPHTIRYWESQITDIRPQTVGNRKLYSRSDLEMIAIVRYLIQDVMLTIDGVRKRIKELKRSGEIASLRLEFIEYRHRNDAKVVDLGRVNESVDDCRDDSCDNDSAMAEIQTPRSLLDASQEEIAQLRLGSENAQDDLVSARSDLEALQNEVSVLHSDLQWRDGEIASMRVSLSATQESLYARESSLSKMQDTMNAQITEISGLEARYRSLSDALKEKESALSESQAELSSTRDELTST